MLVALALPACSGGGGSSVEGDIGMTAAQRFDPETFTVAAGDTVTWVNDSNETHTVTAFDDGIPEGAEYFASGGATSEDDARDDVAGGLIDPDATYEVTFEEPGEYRYVCIPHEATGMEGTIVVEAP